MDDNRAIGVCKQVAVCARAAGTNHWVVGWVRVGKRAQLRAGAEVQELRAAVCAAYEGDGTGLVGVVSCGVGCADGRCASVCKTHLEAGSFGLVRVACWHRPCGFCVQDRGAYNSAMRTTAA